jgi:hypothetical protein
MIILWSNPHRLKIAQKLGKAYKKLVIHAPKPVEKDMGTLPKLFKIHPKGLPPIKLFVLSFVHLTTEGSLLPVRERPRSPSGDAKRKHRYGDRPTMRTN